MSLLETIIDQFNNKMQSGDGDVDGGDHDSGGLNAEMLAMRQPCHRARHQRLNR